MKLVLLQDVKGQGKKDQLIDVSDGYARNYLIPRKLAVEAGKKIINEIKGREASEKYRVETETAAAKEIAEKLEGILLMIKRTPGENGKFYGSVTAMDITDALEKQHGVAIDKKKLKLPDQIKSFGKFDIPVKLYTGITGTIHIVVTEDK
ncbi:MAG: 50S ribosomal protein L9 [Clostridia bacterium]|nr:50S ribosomal protein L9 [Clostridia bacterium]